MATVAHRKAVGEDGLNDDSVIVEQQFLEELSPH